MKIGKRGVLNRFCKFCYLDQHTFITKFMTFHDSPPPPPKIVKIHDLFMTIQVSDSDSGLFRFIHDCGHPDNCTEIDSAQGEAATVFNCTSRMRSQSQLRNDKIIMMQYTNWITELLPSNSF